MLTPCFRGIVTACTAAVSNTAGLYACRFFLGLVRYHQLKSAPPKIILTLYVDRSWHVPGNHPPALLLVST